MSRLTKTAQQAQIAAAYEARLRAALRWVNDAPAPDVAPPEWGGALTPGFVSTWNVLTTGYVFNVRTSRVDVACSSSTSHSIGRTDGTESQRPFWLYSTRLLALRALRTSVQRLCAAQLAAVDLLIEKEGSA